MQLQRPAPHARSGRECASTGAARELQSPRAALQQSFAKSRPVGLLCPLRCEYHVRAALSSPAVPTACPPCALQRRPAAPARLSIPRPTQLESLFRRSDCESTPSLRSMASKSPSLLHQLATAASPVGSRPAIRSLPILPYRAHPNFGFRRLEEEQFAQGASSDGWQCCLRHCHCATLCASPLARLKSLGPTKSSGPPLRFRV